MRFFIKLQPWTANLLRYQQEAQINWSYMYEIMGVKQDYRGFRFVLEIVAVFEY